MNVHTTQYVSINKSTVEIQLHHFQSTMSERREWETAAAGLLWLMDLEAKYR